MKNIYSNFLETKVALFLVFIFTMVSIFQVGYTATDPYISTTDAGRISVPTVQNKIYIDNSATATGVPASTTVGKITNLKPAMTAYKKVVMDNATPDNTVNTTTVSNNKAIIASNNALIASYKANTNIVTASSMADLKTKVDATTANITIKIDTFDVSNNDLSFGNSTKSVTIIANNITVTKNNKKVLIYGNLIVLNALNDNPNFLTLDIKKTSALNDGNLFFAQLTNMNTQITFTIENTFYVANNFSSSKSISLTSNSLVVAGTFTNNYSGSTFNVTDMFYVSSDLTLVQKAFIKAGNLFVGGSVNNNSDSSTFTVTNTFFIITNLILSQKATITTKNLVVECNVTNGSDSSTFNVSATFYVASDMTLNQKAFINANDLIIDGNLANNSNSSNFNITNSFYVDNNFTLTQIAVVASKTLFVGGKVTNSGWDQTFTIAKDIFFAGLSLTGKTTIKSTTGDLIVEDIVSLASDIIIQVSGRVAVGGNVSSTAYNLLFSTGGGTTSVIFNDEQSVQPPAPVISQALTIKKADITQDGDTVGNYKLNITYKRVDGVITEQIIVNGIVVKEIDVASNNVDVVDGFVTFNDIPFTSPTEYASIYVKSIFQQSSSGGVNWNGKNDKPYFTTVASERLSVAASTPTIYVDPSGHISMPANINKVEVKFLKKAISDYGSYFDKLKDSQYSAYEKSATIYNDKTIEQIEAIIAGSSSSNIIIKTNKLNLTKDIKLGSSTKSVTLIVDDLTVNSPRIIEVFGNLVVRNMFNANQAVTIKTYKVNGTGGNYYTNDVNYNGNSTLNIANMLYSNALTLNQGGTITADTIAISGRLTVNLNSTISAVNDMYVRTMVINQTANINVTYGDLVIGGSLRVNSPLTLSVGGRVSVGKNVTFNATSTVTAGRQKTALILPGEGSDIVIVNGDLTSNVINVDLKLGAIYTSEVNKVVKFSNSPIYFSGDSIYYMITLPTNITNVKLTYSLNQSLATNVFAKFPNSDSYSFSILSNGTSLSALPTNSNPVNLVVGPISVEDKASSFIFKTKLRPVINAPISFNDISNVDINNALTVTYTNSDGVNVNIAKKFTTAIVLIPNLRLN